MVSPEADAHLSICDPTGMSGINYLSKRAWAEPEHQHVVCSRLLFLFYFKSHGCLWHGGK